MQLLIIISLVALAAASPAVKRVDNQQYARPDQGYTYRGVFDKACVSDGLYYKDANSFVMCSNNVAYIQLCAPGSRNSDHGNYKSGNNYLSRDFCDINLVDYGYGVSGSGYDDGRYYPVPYGYQQNGYNNYGYNYGANNQYRGYDNRFNNGLYGDARYYGQYNGRRSYGDDSYYNNAGRFNAGAGYNGRAGGRAYYGDYNRRDVYPAANYAGYQTQTGYNPNINKRAY